MQIIPHGENVLVWETIKATNFAESLGSEPLLY